MKFFFSKDYKGPGFGFLTKARMYDKWGHFAGSAAGVLLFVALIRLNAILGPATWNPILGGLGVWIGAVLVFLVGLAYEIYQGVETAQYLERGDYTVQPKNDGFSILDLLCNIGGILLVLWVLAL